jgi:hypothetical protein
LAPQGLRPVLDMEDSKGKAVVLGNLILRCDRAGSAAFGMFRESGFGRHSSRVVG